MKYSLGIVFAIFPFFTGVSNTADTLKNGNNNDTMGNKLKIKIGASSFTAHSSTMKQQPHSKPCYLSL